MGVPTLGLGIGWRPELAWAIERLTTPATRGGIRRPDQAADVPQPTLQFVELVAEDFDPDRLPHSVERLLDQGVTVIPHGVSLSLGSAERPSRDRLRKLARLAEVCRAPLVSEHIAFVRGGGCETGHLLPVQRTREMLDILVENIRLALDVLPVPLALENIATLVEWPQSEMETADFLGEIVSRTGVHLLLDLENIYANSRNHDADGTGELAEGVDLIERLPWDRIAYVHVAGGVEAQTQDAPIAFHDTHTGPVPGPVFQLIEELFARVEVPGMMLERDGRFPPEPELIAELDAIAAAAARGRLRRGACHAA